MLDVQTGTPLHRSQQDFESEAKKLDKVFSDGTGYYPVVEYLTFWLGMCAHRALQRRHRGTLNESTNVRVKTGGSRVGGPELCV